MIFKIVLLIFIIWVINFLAASVSKIQSCAYFFECGFENQSWTFQGPSLHFIKISMIFILFDLELLFLFSMYFCFSVLMTMLLLIVLWVSLWMEFGLGSINWLY